MSATVTSAAGQRDYPALGHLYPFESPPPVDPPSPLRGVEAADLRPGRAQKSPREYAYRLSAFLLGGDFVVAYLAIFGGLAFREWQRVGAHLPDASWSLLRSHVPWWALAGSVVLVWMLAASRTYDVANIYRMWRWLRNLIWSLALWTVAAWACVGLFQFPAYAPRVGILYAVGALLCGLNLWRLAAFVLLVQPRMKEAASARVIVVGWNEQASHLRRAMRHDLAQLSEIIGCVPLPDGRLARRPPPEVAVLGDYASLPALAARCSANTIILADSTLSSRQVQDLITFCQREMIGFQMIPEFFPTLGSGLQVEVVSGVPLLGVNRLPLDRTANRVIKRAIDLVGGLIGFILSAPIIAVFGLLVWFESPGPVIYRQRRMSRSGRVFLIYKIRSMRLNAESGSGAVWCKQDDPRRLKIGAFMRRFNIDELPQFWNVIIGDMSLVGPRPERPELIEKFKDQIPSYNARHEVRTGLTGWAQVNGWRGDTDLGKRIEADLYYLENWSVFLDLWCIVATVFSNKNAH